MLKVALVLEAPFADGAEVVHVTVMFLEFCVAVEKLFKICFDWQVGNGRLDMDDRRGTILDCLVAQTQTGRTSCTVHLIAMQDNHASDSLLTLSWHTEDLLRPAF